MNNSGKIKLMNVVLESYKIEKLNSGNSEKNNKLE